MEGYPGKPVAGQISTTATELQINPLFKHGEMRVFEYY